MASGIFISYSRRDNVEFGRRWATWVDDTLKTYNVPRSLSGKPSRFGDLVPASLRDTILDTRVFGASADLEKAVRHRMISARTLVIICSPRSATSAFVDKEVSWFKLAGGADRIIPVVVAGEPHADVVAQPESRTLPEDECFPPALRFEIDAQGSPDPSRPAPVPAFTDLRLERGIGENTISNERLTKIVLREGYTSSSALRRALRSEGLSRSEIQRLVKRHAVLLEDARLGLLAGVLGVDKLDLRDPDREAERRRTIYRLAIAATLVATFASFATIAALFAVQERKARLQSQTNAAHGRYDVASLRLEQKDPDRQRALADLCWALRQAPNFAPASNLLRRNLMERTWAIPVGPFVPHYEVRNLPRISNDGRLLLTSNAKTNVQLWNVQSGIRIGAACEFVSDVATFDLSPDGRWIAVVGGNELKIWDATQLEAAPKIIVIPETLIRVRFAPSGYFCLTATMKGTVQRWTVDPWKKEGEETYSDRSIAPIVFNSVGDRALVFDGGAAYVIQCADGKQVWKSPKDISLQAADMSSDGRMVVTASSEKVIQLWDVERGQSRGEHIAFLESIDSLLLLEDASSVLANDITGIPVLYDLTWVGKSDKSEVLVWVAPPEGDARRERILACDDGGPLRVWKGPFVIQNAAEPLRYAGKAVRAGWNAASSHFAVGFNEHQARGWYLSSPVVKSASAVRALTDDKALRQFGPVPEWFLQLVEAIAGVRVKGDGALENVTSVPAAILENAKDNPSEESYRRFAEWLLNPAQQREVRFPLGE